MVIFILKRESGVSVLSAINAATLTETSSGHKPGTRSTEPLVVSTPSVHRSTWDCSNPLSVLFI